MEQQFATKVKGHVQIKDAHTNEILLDKDNAVHPQNMARALARGLAHESGGWIYYAKFGNGGTHIDTGGNIIYETPNTVGVNASLYNTTYTAIVDDADATNVINSVTSSASQLPEITSKIVISITLDANTPAGEAGSDGTTTDPDSPYTFDELGLFTGANAENATGSLLTHIVFSPIEKTANRELVITYTLTLTVE